jgi:ribosomal-protein-alanine N-acetyltransferase
MEAKVDSQRLLLRSLDPKSDNLSHYLSWMRDVENNLFIESVKRDMTLRELQSYISDKNRSESALLLGIFEKSSKMHIGNVKLELNCSRQDACLGMLIGSREMRGKSFGYDAIKLLADFAKNEYSLISIYLGVDIKNIAAVKLYEKLGFIPENTYKEVQNRILMRLML